jgi:polygalacturonase
MCEDLTIRNLTVKNPWYSQNGDGLDLESCKNVVIYGNNFDVGDDAICIKSGKNEDGRKRGMPTQNVVIKDNIVYHGHGGFTIGSEMSGGVRNMHISNCTFIGTDIGLRFKSTRGRGGVVENIFISNIDMIDIPAEAIRFNLFYEGQSPIPDGDQKASSIKEIEVPPVTNETPAFRNIFMDNIQAVNCGKAAYFQGLPEMMLQNIQLSNASFVTKGGITIIDAEKMKFSNVNIDQKEENVINIYNGKEVIFDHFTDKSGGFVHISGAKSEGITFKTSSIDQTLIQSSDSAIKDAYQIISVL